MENDSTPRRKLDALFLVMAFFAGSVILADGLTRFIVVVMQVPAPSEIIAGLTEPITTKFIPSIIVWWLHDRYERLDELRSRPFWFALVGGVSVGVAERIQLVRAGGMIDLCSLPAVGVHVINAVLIGGIIFGWRDQHQPYEFDRALLWVIFLAMIIHVFWNALGLPWCSIFLT